MRGFYVLKGSKKQGQKFRRLVLEGPPSNPIRWMDRDGEPVELSEQEYDAWKDTVEFKKVDVSERGPAAESDDSDGGKSEADQQRDQEPAVGGNDPGGTPGAGPVASAPPSTARGRTSRSGS